MILKALEVENYRNIPAARFEPGRELTVICGKNGQGKTNLLEAVWLLTGGKSFRGAKDAQLVRFGAPQAAVEAGFYVAGREQKALLTIEKRRAAALNEARARRALCASTAWITGARPTRREHSRPLCSTPAT